MIDSSRLIKKSCSGLRISTGRVVCLSQIPVLSSFMTEVIELDFTNDHQFLGPIQDRRYYHHSNLSDPENRIIPLKEDFCEINR